MDFEPLPEQPKLHRMLMDFTTVEADDYSVDIVPHAGQRVLRLDGPTVGELRDYVGISADLYKVMEMCRAYARALEGNEPEEVQDALWMGAIVLYVRCFNKGIRTSLNPSMLDTLPGDPRNVHDHFRDLRDKFVAHSVNAYEQSEVYAVVTAAPAEPELLSTGTTHLWANPMNREGIGLLNRLAEHCYTLVVWKTAELASQVHEEAKAMSTSDLYAFPDLTIETPNVERGKKRRR